MKADKVVLALHPSYRRLQRLATRIDRRQGQQRSCLHPEEQPRLPSRVSGGGWLEAVLREDWS
jgi:hypothetical protein